MPCRDLKLRGALIFGKELKLLELEQLYNKVGSPRFRFAEHCGELLLMLCNTPPVLGEHGQSAV